MKYKKGIKYFKYCPVCGTKFKIKKQGHDERLTCPKCNFVFYQNSKPTVSALIINNKNQILLVRRAVSPFKNYWDTPGGFLEDGEDPIHGLKREMTEELGIKLKNFELIGIYTDTYNDCYQTQTLNILYQVAIASGKLKPMDDINGLKWFGVKDIPWKKIAFKWAKNALKEYYSK